MIRLTDHFSLPVVKRVQNGGLAWCVCLYLFLAEWVIDCLYYCMHVSAINEWEVFFILHTFFCQGQFATSKTTHSLLMNPFYQNPAPNISVSSISIMGKQARKAINFNWPNFNFPLATSSVGDVQFVEELVIASKIEIFVDNQWSALHNPLKIYKFTQY